MKSGKITTLISHIYPKAGDAKTVKVRNWNDLMDDIEDGFPLGGVDVTGNKVSAPSGVSMGSTGIVERTAIVNITAAELNGMYVTPVVVVAAPGAGYVLSFKSAILIYDDQGTDYSAGGNISINYSGGAAQSSVLAATFLTGNGDKVWNLEKLNAANGLTQLVNTALVLTNASQAFTTGTGLCRLHITYSVHETGL